MYREPLLSPLFRQFECGAYREPLLSSLFRQFECFCVMKWNKNVSRTSHPTSRPSVRVQSVSRTVQRKLLDTILSFKNWRFQNLKSLEVTESGGRSDEIDTRQFECFCVMKWSKNV